MDPINTFFLNTLYYHSCETSISEMEVEVFVELVPKIDQQKIYKMVVETMYLRGYDLVSYRRKPFGDLVFRFFKNRIVDWNKFYELKEKTLKKYAESICKNARNNQSIDWIKNILKHPYYGIDIEKELLSRCTTNIEN